MGFFMDWSAEP